jgi:hypothetical protein
MSALVIVVMRGDRPAPRGTAIRGPGENGAATSLTRF